MNYIETVRMLQTTQTFQTGSLYALRTRAYWRRVVMQVDVDLPAAVQCAILWCSDSAVAGGNKED
jgi:hypothetical protein